MGTVTGFTADREKQIEDSSVVSGQVDINGRLQLQTRGGQTIDAGVVRGEKGDTGPTGAGAIPKLMQLAPGYVGPGPAFVTEVGDGLGAQSGPFEWSGPYQPNGNRIVRTELYNGVTTITGHAEGLVVGGWRNIPLADPLSVVPHALGAFGYATEMSDSSFLARRSTVGIVTLQGLLRVIKTVNNQTVIATLPEDMRPDTLLMFWGGEGQGRTWIQPTGEIIVLNNRAVGNWVNLSNISFPAAGVATWTPMAETGFLNGARDITAAGSNLAYGNCAYWVDPYGIAWFRGLLQFSVAVPSTNGVPLWTCPAEWSLKNPKGAQHAITSSSLTGASFGGARFNDGTFGVATTMDVAWNQNTNLPLNGYISMAGLTRITQKAFDLLPWTPFRMILSPYTAYSSGYLNQYTLRPDGLVFSMGLLKGGKNAANMFILPDYLLPENRIILPANNGWWAGRIDLMGSRHSGVNVVGVQDRGGWTSLSGLKWAIGGY